MPNKQKLCLIFASRLVALSTLALLTQNCTKGFQPVQSDASSVASITPPQQPAPNPLPTPFISASTSTGMINSLQYSPATLTIAPGKIISLSDGTLLLLTSTGDLQVQNSSGGVLWHSASTGVCAVAANCSALFKNDGNLVIYANNVAIWAAATTGAQALIFANTMPYLSVMSASNQAVWTSGGARSVKAIAANDFLSSLGVNTHADQGYNVNNYISPLQFLGVRNIRDGVGNVNGLLTLKQKVGVQTCASDYYNLTALLSAARTLAAANALLALEGPNEPNDFPGTYNGQAAGGSGSWAPVAQYQSDLFSEAKADSILGKYPVFNPSETGAETTNVGLQFSVIPSGAGALFADGTKFSDFVNIHNYVSSNQSGYQDNQAWSAADPTLDGVWDGLHTESGITWNKHYTGYSPTDLVSVPRVTTETGWDSVANPGGEATQGVVLVNTFLAQFKRGWRYTFIYELIDGEGSSGNQGLFHTDYSAKPAATYIHNLTTVLADTISSANPGSLAYSLIGNSATVHDLLLQKNNGTYELVLWGESTSLTSTVTVNFASARTLVNIYDVTLGSSVANQVANALSVSVQLKDHPVVIELP